MHSSLHVSTHQVHLFAGWISELFNFQDEVTTVKPSVKPADEGFKLGKFLVYFLLGFFSCLPFFYIHHFRLQASVNFFFFRRPHLKGAQA